MGLLNFKKQFAKLIIEGKKHQTIRQARKHPIKKGDTLFLYTGLRTKYCKKIGEVICKEVQEIKITKNAIYVDGVMQGSLLCEIMARDDGFSTFAMMQEFFKNQYELPFFGVLIKW
jgi:hypothetical protein